MTHIAPSFDALASPLVPSAGSGAIDDAGTPEYGQRFSYTGHLPTCPACGDLNPPRAQWCESCGDALTPAAEREAREAGRDHAGRFISKAKVTSSA